MVARLRPAVTPQGAGSALGPLYTLYTNEPFNHNKESLFLPKAAACNVLYITMLITILLDLSKFKIT
jgi:hypothetical protein